MPKVPDKFRKHSSFNIQTRHFTEIDPTQICFVNNLECVKNVKCEGFNLSVLVQQRFGVRITIDVAKAKPIPREKPSV